MKLIKSVPALLMSIGYAVTLSGCSSVMAHTGGNQGYYLGTRANYEVLKDENSRWPIKSLALLDSPFSAVMDTLMLPWDYFRTQDNKNSTLRSQVLRSEELSNGSAVTMDDPDSEAQSPYRAAAIPL